MLAPYIVLTHEIEYVGVNTRKREKPREEHALSGWDLVEQIRHHLACAKHVSLELSVPPEVWEGPRLTVTANSKPVGYIVWK
jgi:hypothetical protein